MDKNNLIKEYTNGEITIVWQNTKCIHSGMCEKKISSVFQPKSQPWIKMDNASSEAIAKAVSQCPSGALSIKK